MVVFLPPSDADPPKADSSLFALADGSPSRTIYTSVTTASAAYPKANETPVSMSAGGGNDQDDYAAALYAGPRTTGMGRQSSNESAGVANGPMGPVSPQEPQRKRLRRGGPAGGEEGSAEGPGSFSDHLQDRLAGVHVQSQPGSQASSALGSTNPSVAPTPPYTGSSESVANASASAMSNGHGPYAASQQAMQTAGQNAGAAAYASPRTAPQEIGSAIPQQAYAYHQPQTYQQQQPRPRPVQQALSPSMPPVDLNNPHFRAFCAQVGGGTRYPYDQCWQAFVRSPSDFKIAHQLLVDAKPAVHPQSAYGAPNPAGGARYAAETGNGTPNGVQQHAAYGHAGPYASVSPGQQAYPTQYAQQAAARQLQQGAAGPYASAGTGQQQSAASGLGMNPSLAQQRAQQSPSVYHAQHQAIAAQQQLANSPTQAARYADIPSQFSHAQYSPAQMTAAANAFQFPPARTGVAGFTDAHLRHYHQLQDEYRSGVISKENFKALQQYTTVLQRKMYTSGAPAANGAMYSQQGVYQPQLRQGGQGGTPKPKPPAPKAHIPQTSGSILARQLQLAGHMGSSSKKKSKKRAYASDSEDDGGDYDSAGSGDEYGSRESPQVIAKREALAIEFFNTCEKDNLMELAGCNATQATLTMKLRPFSSANDFRTRTRKQKGVGNSMLETYLEVISGMNEVDKVLSECEAIGAQLNSVMGLWKSGAALSADSEQSKPGASGADEVGLDLVAITEETLAQRVDNSNDPRIREAFKDYIRRQPAGVPDTVKLKDYQMLGVNWLNLLYHRKTSCILADEMGLGKTAQVIALLAHLKATGEPGPHLVIVPSSVLDNWMREFTVFAPDLNARSYYGSQGERHELRSELRAMGDDLDVVVTTYNIATGSPDDQKFLKRKMNFNVTVFDEGHQLKNSESKKYKDLMMVRAEWRLLLTGTPLQNNLQELVSLLSFILPDKFRDASDSLRAIFKVTPGSQTNLLSRERISRAKKMMTPFVLRRKKVQVLKDLPPKSEAIEYCDMTDLQRDCYNEALQRSRNALTTADEGELEDLEGDDDDDVEVIAGEEEVKPKRGRKKAVASTKLGTKANASSSAHILTDLRKASNHPMLFRRLYDDKTLRAMSKDCLREEEFMDRNKDLIFEDMEVMTDFELHRFAQMYKHLNKYALKNNEWMSAGKIAKLQELLPQMRRDGDRVLIFSQFVQVLDILEVVLDTMELKYLKLTGQTAVGDRQGLVDAYNQNEDITVFLLSTRAGGLGLNLTAANTVIFYDCDYNPHNDKQAQDRAYRIGQTREVKILRLVTRGSLDENMLELATAKLQLDAEVSGGKEGEAEGAEGAAGQTERRMKKSLLSGLKKQFERETAQVAERQQEEKAKIEEIEAEAKTDAPAKAEGDGEEAPKPDANAEAEPEPVKPEEAAA
ncbi:DNA-dependent ATPase fun30 [Rhodotorula sphaerocarpa]